MDLQHHSLRHGANLGILENLWSLPLYHFHHQVLLQAEHKENIFNYKKMDFSVTAIKLIKKIC